ncbi:MAG: omptin family outer membrane protease [Allorhizobium sp.]
MTSFPWTAAACLAVLPLFAAVPAAADNDTFSASIEAGLMRLHATETVVSDGFKLSELDWKSNNVQVLRGSFGINVTRDWQIKGEGRVGRDGDGSMTDYDWVAPYYTDTSKSGWSHQSIHNDTSLDHYFSGSLEINRKFLDDGTQTLSGGFGARYNDVQWTARGGTLLYSVGGFRNYAATIPDGVEAITYRQQIPSLYAHIDGSQVFGRFTFDAGLEGGLMVKAKTTDNHWLRDLKVTDTFDLAPTFAASSGISYKLARSTSLYLKGSYERTNFGSGNSTYRDTVSGAETSYSDLGGGSFEAVYIGGGLKGTF